MGTQIAVKSPPVSFLRCVFVVAMVTWWAAAASLKKMNNHQLKKQQIAARVAAAFSHFAYVDLDGTGSMVLILTTKHNNR